jgi:dihydroflavonol-4-reductase
MLYLVTGATGLVGNNVVRLLLERGQRVRALVRNPTDKALLGLPLDTVAGDVCDQETVGRAAEGVDLIIHAAARVHLGWSGLALQRSVNVEGTRHVAKAAHNAGVRMIHVSSVDALAIGSRAQPADEECPPEGSVLCPYVVTKREAECAVMELVANGLDAVIVNPVYMFGPWDWKPSSGRMILEVARGWALLAPPGGNDFADVRDVAAGILTAAERGQRGRRYILGGEPLSYLEAWRMIADVVGVRGPRRKMLRPGLFIAGRFGDLWAKVRGVEGDINSAAIAMSRLEHHYSYARAAAELDYRPRPAREAVEAAWEWFVDHGYAARRKPATTSSPAASREPER